MIEAEIIIIKILSALIDVVVFFGIVIIAYWFSPLAGTIVAIIMAAVIMWDIKRIARWKPDNEKHS